MAPNASEVTLNGSWDGATNLKMTKDASGVWSTTVGPLAAQLWGYWYLVDGVKALDPGNAETQRDGARYDNLLMISGPASEWWDFKDAARDGAVQSGIRRRR
jgi:enterochelin esterase family protein